MRIDDDLIILEEGLGLCLYQPLDPELQIQGRELNPPNCFFKGWVPVKFSNYDSLVSQIANFMLNN